MRFLRNGSLVLVLIAALSGCGGGEDTVSSAGNSPPPAPMEESQPQSPAPPPLPPASAEPAPTPVAALDCGAEGFPCSLSEVPAAILDRGEALADAVMAMLDAGGSIDAALNYLRAQADLADAASNKVVLRFRLTGGRDVFIFQPEALAPVPPAVAAPTQLTAASARNVATHRIVAGDSVEQKRALVLSPFKYFFQSFDDGAPVAQMLESTRGYAGNVTYLENATKTAATVGIEQFSGWENYDVIHVTGHGAQVCDVNHCVATVLTGDIYSNADDLLRLTVGLEHRPRARHRAEVSCAQP